MYAVLFSLISYLTIINDLNLFDGAKWYENVLELLFICVHAQAKNTYHLARGWIKLSVAEREREREGGREEERMCFTIELQTH